MKSQILNVFLEQIGQRLFIGKLAQYDGEIVFEYDSDFLNSGFEISPFKLPLISGSHVDKDRIFSGLPGVFNDSLPDGWGLLLMDRYFNQQGIEPASVTPLQRLAFIGNRALGALSYEPSYEIPFDWQSNIGLEMLAADCELVLHGEDGEVLPELIIAGGSPGGARPKVVIGVSEEEGKIYSGTTDLPAGYKHYLVKFSTMIDVNDIAEVEYAYSLMARDCGINMPNTRLFSAGKFGKAFGIERFDRIGDQRIHTHTLSGLLHADYRIPNLDYTDYLKATWLLTKNIQEVYQAFRRMVFNVLSHNRDDHSKNFAFIYKDNCWKLSPAYDLTCSAGVAGEHTMTVAGEGANPDKNCFLRVAKKVNVKNKDAEQIIEQTKEVVVRWEEYAEQASVAKNTAQKYKRIFDNISI